MTDDRALREKLEQLIRQQPLDLDGHDSDCRLRDDSPRCSCGLAEYRIALDLLARLDAAETPCVWSETLPKPPLSQMWRTGCDHTHMLGAAPKFCYGCGHPVQVKQKEEK